MRVNRKLIFIFIGIIIGINSYAQVTIGIGEAPAKTALLQLKDQTVDSNNLTSQKGGLLLPRVRLVSLTTLQPFMNPTDANYATEKVLSTGLMVYNIQTPLNNTIPSGVYYWDGAKWQQSATHESFSGANNGSGAVKINVNQSKFIVLSGTQSYGILMQNQSAVINPTYATGVYPGGSTTGSPFSIITSTDGTNGNNEALLLEANDPNKANFFRMNMEFRMGNTPPAQTRYFDIIVTSVGSGVTIYRNSIVVPGGLATGHVGYFQIFFPSIADAASIGVGYRLIFGCDTAASSGLPNNIEVRVVDITRINQ